MIYITERAVITKSPLVLTKCVFKFYSKLRTQILVDKHSGGLDNYEEMMRLLTEEKGAIKVYVNVADN